MDSLKNIFDGIKKSFTIRKKVHFEEYDLHIELEPLTSMQEIKVLEAAREYDGGAYINALKTKSLSYALKSINDVDLSGPEVTYPGEDGQPIVEETSLFLSKQIEQWPAVLRDLMFDAFNNINEEVEARINEKARFNRFTVQTPPNAKSTDSAPEGFKRVEEPKEDKNITDVERMNKQVEKEIEEADFQRTQSDQRAMDRHESR